MAGQPSLTDKKAVVLVEDDLELAGLIKDRLEKEGYHVLHEANGKIACALILAQQPDLVVLDIMLPGMDGFAVCREVRPAYNGPILILTARDDDLDEILGLEMGADDYITKPVRPRVLIARIRALLRRMQQAREHKPESRTIVGELTVDAGRREVQCRGRIIDMTTIEFDLLWYLINRAGEVVSRQDIYLTLFHYDYDGLDRSVDVYISRIRQKLGDDPSGPHYIKTVRSVGYLLADVSV